MSKMDSSASSSANVECSPESRQGVVAELGPFFLIESILFPVKVLGKVRRLILGQSLGIAQNVGVKAVLGDLGGISLQLLELFKAWLKDILFKKKKKKKKSFISPSERRKKDCRRRMDSY